MPLKDLFQRKAYNIIYNSLHKEDNKRRYKKWKEKHPGKSIEHQRKYRKNHPEKDRLYYEKNKEKIKQNTSEYTRTRFKTDPEFRLISNIRSRIKMALRNGSTKKSNPTVKLLGCNGLELRKYLENLWKPGMSWENYGIHGWHIDHKRPLCSFNLSSKTQQKKAFHYSNLQPLWAKENLTKSGKYLEANF